MTKWVIALLSAAILTAAEPTPAQEKEVMAAIDQWIQATIQQDISGLQKVLHDELWYSHSAGTFQSKSEVIQDIQEGRGPVGVELSDVRIRIYGNMAHVKSMAIIRNRPRNQSRSAANSSSGGPKAGPSPLLIVHVLVKGPQGWQLVSRQATRPAPPPSAATPAPAR